MLLTPFSFIWVFQILIGYSKLLRNAYLHIFTFFLKLSMILQFVLDTFTPKWKLLSVSISRMSILVEKCGYNSESWPDTLIKQFNKGINIT